MAALSQMFSFGPLFATDEPCPTGKHKALPYYKTESRASSSIFFESVPHGISSKIDGDCCLCKE